MEFNMWVTKQRIVTLLLASGLLLLAASSFADTYRWKDKDGKVHYGSAVPAEYADQPYDVLNNAGVVIRRVEDTSQTMEELLEKEQSVKERAPLISDEERLRQSNRLLVIQYSSEEDVITALELELAQVGYDERLIHKSYDSTNTAIIDQIRQAADQQRAGVKLSVDHSKEMNKLYRRLARDEERLAALGRRETKIRARFQSDLERYKQLTTENAESTDEDNETRSDQG